MGNPSFLVASSMVTLIVTLVTIAHRAEARAFFIFGDSLVDNGNNNYLATTARADSPPYGIDYPTHRPTGRFSNGLNIPDIISETIGEESTLPYLSPELDGEKLLVGANFASAGIGVLNGTGTQFVNIIRIYRQLSYFQEYQERLSAIIGVDESKKLVNQGLVLITLGGNDFVNNYFLPLSITSRLYSLPDFSRLVISEYTKVLQRLYQLGARKVLVTGTGPLGCVPSELAQGSRNGECVADVQKAAALFNPQLVQMISNLNRQFGSTIFTAVNVYQSKTNFITNPQAFGFVTSKEACCGQGPYNGLGLCTRFSNLCPNRDLYVFWDPFHPTERANRFIVQEIMHGTSEYMNPVNLTTMLAMESNA